MTNESVTLMDLARTQIRTHDKEGIAVKEKMRQ